MGNKNQPASNASSSPTRRQSSFLDLKAPARKKTPQKDEILKLLEPSVFFGHCIQAEPEEQAFEISCAFCKFVNFDDGLEVPTRCAQCNNLYVAKDCGVQKLPETQNIQLIPNKSLPGTKKPKELIHLVLYCNSDSLPMELKNENEIDFETISKKIVIPFFSIKSRVVRFGMMFKIGNFEFKAVSCEPRLGGRITKATRIHCYKDYCSAQNLEVIKIGLKSRLISHYSEEEILRNVSQLRSCIHLSTDQSLVLNNQDLNVVWAMPPNGNLTKDTKIEFFEPLKEIKTMSLAIGQDTMRKFIGSTKVESLQEIEDIIRRNYVLPFFQGISRFVERGKYLSLTCSDELYIRDCVPAMGFVCGKTKITLLLLGFSEPFSPPNPNIQSRETSAYSLNMQAMGQKPNELRFLSVSSDEENPENGENEGENEEEEEPDEEEEEKINTSNHVYRGGNVQRLAPSFPAGNGEMVPARNHNHLEFEDNVNEESDSSGGNYGSNLNSDNSIPIEPQQQQIADPYDESSLLSRMERERFERDRIRLQFMRPPQLRAMGEQQTSPEDINNAIHRVLNAFLLFNDPFMQSVLANRNNGNNGGPLLHPNPSNQIGATKFQINRLPERKIAKEFIAEKRFIEENLTKCMICLNEYEDQDSVRTMPCMHYFHKICLDVWLVKCKTCPICKTACDVNEKELLNMEV